MKRNMYRTDEEFERNVFPYLYEKKLEMKEKNQEGSFSSYSFISRD